MRRITMWFASTATMLVLLFSYHTSTSSGATTSISSPANGVVAAGSGTTGATSDSGSSSDSSGSSGSSGSSASTGSAGTSRGSSTGSSSGSSSGSASGGSSSAARSVTGDAVSTRYGNVQVKITVANGKVTAAEVTQVPWSDHRDQQINSRAVPILNDEAVAAQSSNIDMVSGATFTSDGYIQSLQSALDQAGL